MTKFEKKKPKTIKKKKKMEEIIVIKKKSCKKISDTRCSPHNGKMDKGM